MIEPTQLYDGNVTVKRNIQHTYYVIDKTQFGDEKYHRIPGVTGILEELYDQRNLIDWASGMAAKNIVLALAGEKHASWLDKAFLAIYKGELPSVPNKASEIVIQPFTGQDLLFLYQNGVNAYKIKAQYGKDVGTQVHDAIDRWHTTGDTHIDPSGVPEQDEVAKDSFKNYQHWYHKSGLEIYESERPVYSRKHGFCGQLDRVYKDKAGGLILGDFKTSNVSRNCPTGIREAYWSQVGAYTLAFEEETGLQIKDLIITNSPKNGKVQVLRASSVGFTPTYAKQLWLDDMKAGRNHRAMSGMMRGIKSEV